MSKVVRKFEVTLILNLFLVSGIYAQTAATEIETLFETNAVTYAQAARRRHDLTGGNVDFAV